MIQNSDANKVDVKDGEISSQRTWVKPALERLSLKDALTGGTGGTDATSAASS